MTGDIRHEENHEVVADCEVVSEIATEIERGNHCVAENVVIEHQRRGGQHFQLHLATRLLILLQHFYRGAQFIVGGFQAPPGFAQLPSHLTLAHAALD